MKLSILAAAFCLVALGGPAAGQVSAGAQGQMDLLNQQMLDRQRAVALDTQLDAMDARLKTEQRLRALDAAANPQPLGSHAGTAMDQTPPGVTPPYASIPDDALAASNARVREATQNRR